MKMQVSPGLRRKEKLNLVFVQFLCAPPDPSESVFWVGFRVYLLKRYLSFVFFFRSCGVVCEAFYSIKNAQGSGRGRPRKLRGRMSFAEGCGRLRKGMLVRGTMRDQQIEYEFDYPDVA